VICPRCKEEIPPGAEVCALCDLPGAAPEVQDSGVMGAIIPTKNSKALLAYYLGVFSIIPCIGSPLGIAAFVLGLQGLKLAKSNPLAKGTVHAWVGIVLGGIFGLLWTVGIVVAIVGAVAKE
jgi:hypothetical protein